MKFHVSHFLWENFHMNPISWSVPWNFNVGKWNSQNPFRYRGKVPAFQWWLCICWKSFLLIFFLHRSSKCCLDFSSIHQGRNCRWVFTQKVLETLEQIGRIVWWVIRKSKIRDVWWRWFWIFFICSTFAFIVFLWIRMFPFRFQIQLFKFPANIEQYCLCKFSARTEWEKSRKRNSSSNQWSRDWFSQQRYVNDSDWV